MAQMMDVVGSLHKIARELIDIGVEVNEPFEIVAKIGAASFLLHWIADGLEHELQLAQERGRVLARKELG